MVSDRWLSADLAVVGEADLDVRIAVVLVVTPKFEQAVNVSLAVGRGSSSLIFPPSVGVQPLISGCAIVVEGSGGLE